MSEHEEGTSKCDDELDGSMTESVQRWVDLFANLGALFGSGDVFSSILTNRYK